MKPKHKVYLRLNIMSLVFLVISLTSVTLAWFAYSGVVNVDTEIGVKAWHIELKKDGEVVSNDIVISLPEIYPGMNTVNETVSIQNLGDSDAEVSYSIISARILGAPEDNYVVDEVNTNSPYVEDVLSHEYPFHININLTKHYAISQGSESLFEVSISWPLDSDNDAFDSLWGTKAYEFQASEDELKIADPNYQIRPSIQVVISLKAEQYLGADTSSDVRYNLGDTVLFDVVNNNVCTQVSSTCLETSVIDVNNKLNDNTVSLLPNPNNTYLGSAYDNYDSALATVTNGWTINTRPLLVNDLLKVISTDVTNSFLIRDGISNLIIGNLNYNNRISTEMTKAINYSGYYRFTNQKFDYISSTDCYWTNTEYNSNNGFAIKQIDENNTKIYGEPKTSSCKVIPVLVVSKTSL